MENRKEQKGLAEKTLRKVLESNGTLYFRNHFVISLEEMTALISDNAKIISLNFLDESIGGKYINSVSYEGYPFISLSGKPYAPIIPPC